MGSAFRIEPLGSDGLDRLAPLWLALHAHHQTVAPELAPYVGDEESWRVRRALYADVLAGGGFVRVARRDGRDVAYACVAREPNPWPATFATAPEVAELETLVVHADVRAGGLGTALLDDVDARLAAEGLDDRLVGAMAGNLRAIDLYRRRGFRPAWTTLTRFGRPAPAPSAVPAPTAAVAADEVDALEPLVRAAHRRRQAVAPHLAPYVSEEASWAAARPALREAAAAGRLWRSGPPDAPRAAASAAVARDDPFWADTWRTGRDVADVDVLAADDGLATALHAAVDAHLAAAGVVDQAVGALAADAAAIGRAAARGFRPTWLALTRFGAGA